MANFPPIRWLIWQAESSRRSGSSLRRLVCERDHGVCAEATCKRDCLALVSRLKAINDHQKRREVLLRADSRFGDDRGRKLRERLVLDPIAGHAWHADHVTAVYEGGGECEIDNLRTLCVLCHAEVTRKQTAERAAARRISKENQRRSFEDAQGQRRLVSFADGITLSQPSPTTLKPEGHDTFELENDDSDGISLVPSITRDDRSKCDSLAAISGSASKPSSSSAGHKNSLRGHANAGQASRGGINPSFGQERGEMRPFLESFDQFMNEDDFTVNARAPNPRGRSSSEISFTRVRRIRRPLNDD